MTRLIAAFPATGKSYMASHMPGVADSDSSPQRAWAALFDDDCNATQPPTGRNAMIERQNAAIMWFTSDAGDGHPGTGYGSAKVKCSECDGWEGIVCPHGCGVHLVSIAHAERRKGPHDA